MACQKACIPFSQRMWQQAKARVRYGKNIPGKDTLVIHLSIGMVQVMPHGVFNRPRLCSKPCNAFNGNLWEWKGVAPTLRFLLYRLLYGDWLWHTLKYPLLFQLISLSHFSAPRHVEMSVVCSTSITSGRRGRLLRRGGRVCEDAWDARHLFHWRMSDHPVGCMAYR